MVSNSLATILLATLLSTSSGYAQKCTCKSLRVRTTDCKSNPRRGQVCDLAIRQRTVLCLSGVRCRDTVKCLDWSTCAGSWSKWSSAGRCSTRCGAGFQPSARYCYRQGNVRQGNVRVTSCLGSKGKSEETRNVTCSSRLGCVRPRTTTIVAATTTKRPTTTTTTTTRTVTTTNLANDHGNRIRTRPFSIAPPRGTKPNRPNKPNGSTRNHPTSTNPGVSDEIPFSTQANSSIGAGGTSPKTEANTPAKLAPPAPVDVTLLAAILGSVGILCICIVVIACLVSRRKKSSGLDNLAIRRIPTSADRVFRSEGQNPNYEEPGGPPLPHRPQGLGSNMEEAGNPLYESIDPRKMDSTPAVEEAYDGLSVNGTGYLQPLTPPPTIIPEPVYFSLEGHHH